MKKLFWLFPVLFLIDNILGLNGYQFTVFGIGIRILLFGLSAVSLFLYCLYTVRVQKICILKKKPGQKRPVLPLRFSKYGDPDVEKWYSTHYVDSKRITEIKQAAFAENDEERNSPETDVSDNESQN